MGGLAEILGELRRRRVFRALVGWGVASFAVLQVVEPVLHAYHLPEWTLTVVVTVLAAGFPATVMLSWVFDFTVSGVTRTPPPSGAPAGRTPSRGRLAAYLVGLGLLAAAPGLVYFFAWPGVAWRRAATPAAGATATDVPSIAVLPFANLSSDREQEYFSDGIAEEILNALAQVPGLRVIGRTSSFAVKGTSDDLRSIGKRLGASNLLEGSVRKSGTRVRITAQLIEATNGSHLWSQEFDRQIDDVFAVQEEIARAVVSALKVKLLPRQAEVAHAADPRAHDQYLLGVAYLARGSWSSFERAVKALRQAVAIDPGYAPAWAALSMALFWHGDQAPDGNPATEWAEALEAADKAIALAPDGADGWRARGLVREGARQDWQGALADLERARTLAPQNPLVLSLYATVLAALGQLSAAIPLFQEAAVLDPLAPDILANLSSSYLGTGQLPLAEDAARRALETAPDHGRAARNLGFALLLQGRLDEASGAFLRSSNALFRSMGEVLVAKSRGQAGEAQRLLDRLESTLPDSSSYQAAEMNAWLGNRDRAFAWLDRAVKAHDAGLLYLKYDPFLRSLRDDTRYADLLARLKLPPG